MLKIGCENNLLIIGASSFSSSSSNMLEVNAVLFAGAFSKAFRSDVSLFTFFERKAHRFIVTVTVALGRIKNFRGHCWRFF
jgi:hypothetical protein